MSKRSLRSTIGICDGFNFLLPANMVADIQSGVSATPVENAPAWQRGELAWHGLVIPVISFEQIISNRHARLRGSHIAVLRGTADIDRLPFYGLPTQAMPTEYQLESETDMVVESISEGFQQVAAAVRVRGVPCIIPDIQKIEAGILAGLNDPGGTA